jgi:hypothetical protein
MQPKAAEVAAANGKGKGKKPSKRQRPAPAEGSAAQPSAAQNVPAFVLTKQQKELVADRLANGTGTGHVPKNWSSPNVKECFEHPSYLKAHDWLLLAGPLGRYALQGLLPASMEDTLFQYMEFLEKLTAKEFSAAVIPSLKVEAAVVLAQMERDFPAWELDITRHMVIHLPEQIESRGPPWAFSMWSYERLWNRLNRWRAQQVHPEATIANTYKAFKVASAALIASGKPSHHFRTFDRESNAILLPAYIQDAGVLDIHFSDAQPMQLLSSKQVAKKNMTAELHALHLRVDREYAELWDQCLRDLGKNSAMLTVAQAGELLPQWKSWSDKQEGLTEKQRRYAWGPHSEVRAFDRATINGSSLIVAHQQEKSKYKNDIVIMETAAKGIEVGRVLAFLEHAPAGAIPYAASAASLDEYLQIAQVEWYGRVPQPSSARGQVPSQRACANTVVSIKPKSDAHNGNLWLASDLVPANVALVPRILASGLLSTTHWQVMRARCKRVDSIKIY